MNVYIAAPFGNYIHRSGISSIMGTFTLKQRPGLILQLIKTLRYSFIDKAWYNALGLRNPGILEGLHRYDKNSRERLISIAAIEPSDWQSLHDIIPFHIPLEINISCPNISKFIHYVKDIHIFANRNPIIKLPPEILDRELKEIYDMGFRRFHSCNTLKTSKGARSGSILRNFVTNQIRTLKEMDETNTCIAGGGITEIFDIHYYQSIGADAYSLGSVCFHPIKFKKLMNEIAQLKRKGN